MSEADLAAEQAIRDIIAAARPASARTWRRALVGTGFAYDATVRELQARVVARLLPQVHDVRRMGSAADGAPGGIVVAPAGLLQALEEVVG